MLASMVLTRHRHPWFPTSPWKILGYKEHREEHRRQEHRQPHGHVVGQLSDAGPPQVSVFTHTQPSTFSERCSPHSSDGIRVFANLNSIYARAISPAKDSTRHASHAETQHKEVFTRHNYASVAVTQTVLWQRLGVGR